MTIRSGLRRAGWGVADQALSSVTNFALALLAARSSTARGFGSFALVFAVYTVFLGAARALTTEPLALRYSAAPASERLEATRLAAGAALATGLGGALVCAAAAALVGGPTRSSFLALAIALPGLLLQDAYRLAFFVDGRGRSAFLNDALWALLLAASLGVAGDSSVAGLLLAWGLAGSVAGVVGALQRRAAPDVLGTGRWWRANKSVGGDLVGDFVALTASAHLWLFSAGAVAGLAAAGALRGGQTLLGPLNVVFMGAALVAVPEAVRWHARSPQMLVRRCLATSVALAGASLLWGAALLMVPDSVGEELLGATWRHAHRTVLPLTIWMTASGVVAGLALGLRASGRTRRALGVRAISGAASVVGAATGAVAGGARGAAWGLAVAVAAGSVLWWRQLLEVAAGPSEPPGPAETLAEGLPV